MGRGLSILTLALSAGCATAKLAQERAFVPPDTGVVRSVVIEPFFELADWKTTTRTDYANVSPGLGYGSLRYGPFGTGIVPVTSIVATKPLFARVEVLVELHKRLVLAVQRLRPSWRVTSTGGANLLTGEVVVVRTIIEGNEITVSDRALKSFCFGVGLLVWPLLFCAAQPVEETEHVTGLLERVTTRAELVQARLVKYPTQADYAVNLAGLWALRRPFGLDVTYTEGVVADEGPRQGVLIEGLVDRLTAAVIALVEEPELLPLPSPTPSVPTP
jgi:hypothetical protein